MTITSVPCGYQALRKGRFSVPQQIYFITFNTKDREQIFHNWELACFAARMLSMNSTWGDAKILSWVLMPDHFHGLIQIGDDQSLSAIIKKAKGNTAISINRHRQQNGSIWMDGFYDHAIRKEEDLPSIARYMVLNPVRAGLVKRCGDCPFWNAIWLE